MADKSPELLMLEKIAATLDELVSVEKKVLKELRDTQAAPTVAKPKTSSRSKAS